jgi:hypothetical protein
MKRVGQFPERRRETRQIKIIETAGFLTYKEYEIEIVIPGLTRNPEKLTDISRYKAPMQAVDQQAYSLK